ncbi:MAG TPA: DUF3617 family protein [Hyphomonadaceae bacterium]|jgi:hypothetical protein|nr:DUF3617 family protein [Hyphomonadaceae bacterium]
MAFRAALGLLIGGLMTAGLAVAQTPSDAKIQTGQWESTETVSEMVNPLLSSTQIANRLAKPAVVKFCVKSASLRDMLVGTDKAGLCSGEVAIANGKISGSRNCTAGLKGTRKIEGAYTVTTVDTMRETTTETQKGPAHTKSHLVSKRIGDCS